MTVGRRGLFWLLVLPPVIVIVLFVVAPLILTAVISVRPDQRPPLLAGFDPTLEHYQNLFEKGAYWGLLGVSIGLAAIVAMIATVLAYPVAYFLAFRAGERATLLLLLLLIPFWTSFLLRVMAWKLILGSDGALNSVLLGTGLISEPLAALLYNRTAVAITLVYVWIPFATLPILANLQRVDPALHDAAADLGASPFSQFLRVTLPLSVPGVIACFFMVFIPTVGEYVTPILVGGSRGTLFGNIIQDFFTKAANWPLGSALSMIMLVGTITLVAVALRLIDVRRFAPR
ncbi:MAG: ABC transporter permease [Candidatus Limnocylindrales bacterium]